MNTHNTFLLLFSSFLNAWIKEEKKKHFHTEMLTTHNFSLTKQKINQCKGFFFSSFSINLILYSTRLSRKTMLPSFVEHIPKNEDC